jgi:hypothetical protein
MWVDWCFFLAGIFAGFFVLLLILIVPSLRFRVDSTRRNPRSPPRLPRIQYNTKFPLDWFNKLSSCIYASFINRHAIHHVLREAFDGIPTETGAVRSLELINFDVGHISPPGINSISLIASNRRDLVEFSLQFAPELLIQVAADIVIPWLGLTRITARIKLHCLCGHFNLFIPPKEGAMELRILDDTNLNCDFETIIGSYVRLDTEAISYIWSTLLSRVHASLRSREFKIPLEAALERRPDTQRRPEVKPTQSRKQTRSIIAVHRFTDFSDFVF